MPETRSGEGAYRTVFFTTVAVLAKGCVMVFGRLPESSESLESAFRGIRTVYLVTGNGPTAEKQRMNVVDVAKGRRVPSPDT